MINSVTQGDRSSLIHCLEPRIKIVSAFAYSIIIAVSDDFTTLGAALLTGLILAYLGRIELRFILKRLSVLIGFLILIWAFLPITYEGQTLFRIGGLIPINDNGVYLASRISLKSISILLVMLSLVATSNVAVLGHALKRLGIPSKLILLILLTYRYIELLQDEYGRLKRAAEIRGFKAGTNLHTYRTIALFLAMLLIRAIERAERVNWAMKCRGFTGEFHTLEDFYFQRHDVFFAVACALSLMGLFLLEWII